MIANDIWRLFQNHTINRNIFKAIDKNQVTFVQSCNWKHLNRFNSCILIIILNNYLNGMSSASRQKVPLKFLGPIFFSKKLGLGLKVPIINKTYLSVSNDIPPSQYATLHKKWSFLLRISLVNVNKSSRNYGYSLLLKKSLMEN